MPMSVARASVIMIITLIASRVLGWLRLSVIGAQFGGDLRELDAFWAAFQIPNTIFDLLVAGALTAAFVPVFVSYLAKENEVEAWHVASSVMNALLLMLIGLSGLMWLAAPWIMPLIAPQFEPAQLAIATELTRIMLLSPIFMGLSSLFTGVLNSYRQFLSGATAPVVYNATQILFALFLSPFLGIHALALGVVAGAAMMWLVQVPELTFRRTRYRLVLDLAHPGVREVIKLAIPRTLSLGVVHVVFFVDVILASGMAPGSLTALTYAFQLMLLPLGVFSIAISAAVFPTLSRYASLGQEGMMREALQRSIRWILFLTLPTVIVMVVLRRPIVHLLFQYNEFGPALREATAAAFLFYALGLTGHALIQILARAYYAARDTLTPLSITLISIGLNVVLAVLLAGPLGINGLALANSLATLFEATLFFVLLAPRARLRLAGVGLSMLKVITASLTCGIAMFIFIRATNLPFDLAVDPAKPVLLLQTMLAAAVGVAVYVSASRLIGIGELDEIVAVVRQRLSRGGGPPPAEVPAV